MKLHEYQSKTWLSRYEVPVQHGELAYSPDDAYNIVARYNVLSVLKPQVMAGSRAKFGGVRIANSPEVARQQAKHMLSMVVEGMRVTKILIEPFAAVKYQIYLGISNDRAEGKPVLIAALIDDMDVEDIAQSKPEAVIREHIEPLIGLRMYQVMHVASHLNLPHHLWYELNTITQRVYECYQESDATLIELSPLAVTNEDAFIGLNARIIIDDNALFRQQELAAIYDNSGERPEEVSAREAGLSYIGFQGQIGCLVNGAGLAMAVMDMIQLYGKDEVKPANFLDIGGSGSTLNKVMLALEIILATPDVAVVLINVFGGLTRCDEVAKGIIGAYDLSRSHLPLIVRFDGTNAEIGRMMLAQSGLPRVSMVDTSSQAVLLAVEHLRAYGVDNVDTPQ